MHVIAALLCLGLFCTVLLLLHVALGWPRSYVIGRQGNPYLTRWDLLGTRFSSWFPLRLFLHRFHRSDSDAALHDHPWWFVSIILRGGYYERTDRGTRWHGAGSVLPRPASWRHRVILRKGTEGSVWTLVLTGPKSRSWGFHCPRGWTHWKVVVDREEAGVRGCE